MKTETKYFLFGVISAILVYMLYEFFNEKNNKVNQIAFMQMPNFQSEKKCSCQSGQSSCGCGGHSRNQQVDNEIVQTEMSSFNNNGYALDMNALLNQYYS